MNNADFVGAIVHKAVPAANFRGNLYLLYLFIFFIIYLLSTYFIILLYYYIIILLYFIIYCYILLYVIIIYLFIIFLLAYADSGWLLDVPTYAAPYASRDQIMQLYT